MNLKSIFSKYINGNQVLNKVVKKSDNSKNEDELNVLETSDQPTNRTKKYKAVK